MYIKLCTTYCKARLTPYSRAVCPSRNRLDTHTTFQTSYPSVIKQFIHLRQSNSIINWRTSSLKSTTRHFTIKVQWLSKSDAFPKQRQTSTTQLLYPTSRFSSPIHQAHTLTTLAVAPVLRSCVQGMGERDRKVRNMCPRENMYVVFNKMFELFDHIQSWRPYIAF